MRIIRTDEVIFEDVFYQITHRGNMFNEDIWETVRGIVEDVAARKNEALFEYTKKLDGYALNADTVAVSPEEMENAIRQVEADDLAILRMATERIERFHLKQRVLDWMYSDEEGIELGQRIIPLERVGIYTPGGLAFYPSTVIMAAVPARIAGVEEILLVTPSKGGEVNPLIAAAAKLSGVQRIFKIGGAQAIAALAYGTESIPKVDKIVGPGNAYVAAAKKMVYGQVAIDMIAGPSEVLIIADTTAEASFVAADLLAQAEHDEMASAILLTPDETLAKKVAFEVDLQLNTLQKKSIAMRALEDFGAVFVTKDIDEAIAIANRFAPEHLELMVKNPREMLPKIKHAGAVFLGHNTPETLGDYIAGPNHILPTGGTARFSSPLGVYDFVKRSSVLSFSPEALQKYGKQAARFAEMEGLDAHGKSVAIRMTRKKS
ncbi:MAG: histidinol dehydrogenase [Deltaproteobacteria bacterium]|nr:histidinol dehydrogenase [Deltaproteobacteria bacterium]